MDGNALSTVDNRKREKKRRRRMLKIYCCLEHIELALDDLVNETEMPPQLEQIEAEDQLSTTCEYCQKPSAYVVSNDYSHT